MRRKKLKILMTMATMMTTTVMMMKLVAVEMKLGGLLTFKPLLSPLFSKFVFAGKPSSAPLIPPTILEKALTKGSLLAADKLGTEITNKGRSKSAQKALLNLPYRHWMADSI